MRWISAQYDTGFFFCGWGQGFFKSESYVKPSTRTPTQGQQLMEETKAAYFVQDGNSCSANKWCSTRGELYWSHKLLHGQKSESSFMCFMLVPGWEGVGRHSWYLHRGFSDQCWLLKAVHLLKSFKKAEKREEKDSPPYEVVKLQRPALSSKIVTNIWFSPMISRASSLQLQKELLRILVSEHEVTPAPPSFPKTAGQFAVNILTPLGTFIRFFPFFLFQVVYSTSRHISVSSKMLWDNLNKSLFASDTTKRNKENGVNSFPLFI